MPGKKYVFIQLSQATLNNGALSHARKTRSLALRPLNQRTLPTETVVTHAVAEVDEAEGAVLVGAVPHAARSLVVVTRM